MEIQILNDLPLIYTKDKDFVASLRKEMFKGGNVVLLPKDAVLVVKPILQGIEVKFTKPLKEI